MTSPEKRKLVASDIHVSFGGIHALTGVNLTLETGDILGLIGPNGAGKTTMVNVLTGFQKPSPGSITLDDRDISKFKAIQMARVGIARSFQSARLFGGLNVLENLVAAGLGVGLSRKAAEQRAIEILDWMEFSQDPEQSCSALPYSDERRISIARALALSPSFVLLDEPASGMNDEECESLMETIRKIPAHFNCGVLLIEHNMQVIMEVCDRIHVLDGGKSLAEGSPEVIRNDPQVLRAYLGDDAPSDHMAI